MSPPQAEFQTVDAPGRHRFELLAGGTVIGQARYALVSSTDAGAAERIVFFHTEVDETHSGRGLAADLVTVALDESIAAGRTIVPVCPYVAAFVKRHEQRYAVHVARATPTDLAAVDQEVRG